MKEVKRPWGNFKRFTLNKKCTVKLLTINPNQESSLQSHKKRTEDWYFLSNGRVQVGNKKFSVKEGDFIHIRKNEKHRIFAPKGKVKLIEISFGHFDEKDETRFSDKYGRI
jgi:mannose-6-phosphate isomerase-like protein (cupin superfamily)